MVERGALAALGPNQYLLGQQVAAQVSRILKGDPLSKIPVEYAKVQELHLNLKEAAKLGIEIPQSVREKADKVVE